MTVPSEPPTPQYRITNAAAAVSLLLLVILFAIAGLLQGSLTGVVVGFFVTFFFLGIPLAFWRVAASRGTERVLRHIIMRKPHEKLMRRIHLPRSESSEYVLTGSPRLPPSLA